VNHGDLGVSVAREGNVVLVERGGKGGGLRGGNSRRRCESLHVPPDDVSINKFTS
jgi:hypothetical protein